MCMTTAAIITTVAAVGGSVGGAVIASHGQTEAAETNAQAAEKAGDKTAQSTREALDFQKQVYGQRQAQLSPYSTIGTGALNQLSSGLGIRPTTPVNVPMTLSNGQPAMPQQGQQGSIGALGAQAAKLPTDASMGGMVTVKAPTGETRQVPSGLAEFYTARGAQVVPTGGA